MTSHIAAVSGRLKHQETLRDMDVLQVTESEKQNMALTCNEWIIKYLYHDTT